MTMLNRINLKRAWIGVVLAYSFIRALLIWKIFAKFGVNPFIYLIIDLVSAYFYAIYSANLVEAVIKRQHRLTLKFLLLSLITNFLPDLYVLVSANSVPSFIFRTFIDVILILAIFATIGIIREIIHRRK